MKNLFFLMVLFFTGVAWLAADEKADGDFSAALEGVKNPFVMDLPKPSVVIQPTGPLTSKPILLKETIVLPDLKLQGVIVGADIHKAVINDQIVSVQKTIQGARVITVTKEGVGLLFKGKKFFLKAN